MHMMFTMSLLFAVTTFAVMLMGAWCWLCFRVGCWMFNVLFRGSPRPRDLRVVAPQLAPVYACAYHAPQGPQAAPVPPPKPPVSYSTRRCHHGGAGVVMTVLGVALVVFAFRSFSHRSSPR